MRPGLRALSLVLVGVALAGCQQESSTPAPTPTGPQQVNLAYTVPSGMKEITVPSAPASGGMRYDIHLYQGSDECQLRVVRLLLPKGDGSEDQDATYNMLGAIMRESGVTTIETDGLMVTGRPGPVPALQASGHNSELDLHAAGRMSNVSLQGFQVVYGCPRGELDAKTWDALVASLNVNGFTGPLTMH